MTTGTYSGKRWDRARKAVFARDRSRCQSCGDTKCLHAHHIKPVQEFDNPEDAHYRDNLVVLCKYCHPQFEGTDKRPSLLEAADGLLMSDIVRDLVSDSVEALLQRIEPITIYDYYIWTNPDICNNCHSLRAESTCPNCGRIGGTLRNNPYSLSESVKRVHCLIERLNSLPIRYDTDTLYNSVRALKSTRDITNDDRAVFRTALAAAVQAEQSW